MYSSLWIWSVYAHKARWSHNNSIERAVFCCVHIIIDGVKPCYTFQTRRIQRLLIIFYFSTRACSNCRLHETADTFTASEDLDLLPPCRLFLYQEYSYVQEIRFFFLQKHHIFNWDFALAVNLSAQVIKLTANRCKRGINLSAASFCRMNPTVLCASSWKKSRNVPFHQVDLSSNLLAVYLTITSTQSGSPWWRQTCLSRDLWNNCRAENQQNATAAAKLSGFSQQQQQRCRSSGLSFCLISAVQSHQQP